MKVLFKFHVKQTDSDTNSKNSVVILNFQILQSSV